MVLTRYKKSKKKKRRTKGRTKRRTKGRTKRRTKGRTKRNKRRYKRRTKRRTKSQLNKMKRKLRRKRKKRGGGLLIPSTFKCNYPSNAGEIFSKIPNNINQALPNPINANTNSKPLTGHHYNLAGGGFMDSFGMGDALLGMYKGANKINNIPIRYKGGSPLMDPDPMYQPGLINSDFTTKTANIPEIYNLAANKAAL
jgi:hypothetical protein